jgi:hypothetical protein
LIISFYFERIFSSFDLFICQINKILIIHSEDFQNHDETGFKGSLLQSDNSKAFRPQRSLALALALVV